MSFNIDDIKVDEKNFSIWQEIRDFSIIFIIIVGFGWLFINAQLITIIFDSIVNKTSVSANEIIFPSSQKAVNLSSVENKQEKEGNEDISRLKERIFKEKLSKKLSNIKNIERTDILYKPSYESIIKNNIKSYNINFNILPPDNRLIIPKIWVDAHIVTLTNVPIKTIEDANYDDYLYKWVVKYPYTWKPWEKWNVFIFGHTSYYWWKKNPYGTVFAKIPQLRHWYSIYLIWNWKEHEYKIFKKVVVYPNQVDEVYKKYQDGEYLTIMWCYPIWSDKQRMLVIAKKE